MDKIKYVLITKNDNGKYNIKIDIDVIRYSKVAGFKYRYINANNTNDWIATQYGIYKYNDFIEKDGNYIMFVDDELNLSDNDLKALAYCKIETFIDNEISNLTFKKYDILESCFGDLDIKF